MPGNFTQLTSRLERLLSEIMNETVRYDELGDDFWQGSSQLKTGTSSAGRSEFHERRERRDLCAEKMKSTLDLIWGGSSAIEERTRLLVTERIFGIKS